MIIRSNNSKEMPLNVVGSSTFGRYPKISIEKTYNMFKSDDWLIPYSGYKSVIKQLGLKGRALFTSKVLKDMVAVIDDKVYVLNVEFSPDKNPPYEFNPVQVGVLNTFKDKVWIAENNAGQIAISDSANIYIYAPNATPSFQVVSTNFTPGYITFHNTRFLCAATNDQFFSPPANNIWRLSELNDGTQWPSDAAHVGLLQSKPDVTQAVIRFPSRGNMVFVMGKTVTEPWFDVGYQLFPYQRTASFNIDYGCVSAATIAATDQFVVWLGQNEKSGPVLLSSDGGVPEKISTDGIDFVLSNLIAPTDSEAFIYRQDGHLFYHINFYTDNLSLFYDFNTKMIYHACDENDNYFIINSVAFFNNQYYGISSTNGDIYAFDTLYTTYDGAEIPRIRTCAPIRSKTQEYFIANDIGFTIEQGTTDYKYQANGTPIVPRVDFSYSIDGGQSFGSYQSYELNSIGKNINKLMWWQLGMANDFVAQFRFWGMGRFCAYDGILNIRT